MAVERAIKATDDIKSTKQLAIKETTAEGDDKVEEEPEAEDTDESIDLD
jgi:hypothetical protein